MDKKLSKEEIFLNISNILVTEFEIDKSLIKEDSNLFDDLELDSIDVVDLAVRLQKYTQKRLTPDEFKQIKTIKDVVEVLYSLI